MIALNRIRCINQLANLSRIAEVRREFQPVVLPITDDERILCAPLIPKVREGKLRLFQCKSLVHTLRVDHHHLLICKRDILHRVPDLMNDTELNIRLWEYRKNGLREVRKPALTGDQDVFDSSIFQVCAHAKPEAGTLILTNPNAQYLLVTRHTNGPVHYKQPY